VKPTPEQKESAIQHIVYEYANLVSAGARLLQTGPDALKPPDNTHVQDAYLLSCRKMANFFAEQRAKHDVIAYDYVPRSAIQFTLSEWIKWGEAADTHVAHISYTRTKNMISWDGTGNEPLLNDFRRAWRKFLSAIDDNRLKAEFARRIAERAACVGFGGLDLGS
jgi:hypothetical protein